MSKLPTRLVIAILAIGTLVGAATVMSTGLKPFNQALAQLRVRSYPSGTGSSPIATAAQAQPPIQQPTARAVGTNAPPASAGLPFSFIFPCTGCIITKNLANGAVTTQKIAPGAISISVVERMGAPKDIVPGGSAVAVAVCKPGKVATGGGYDSATGLVITHEGTIVPVPPSNVSAWVLNVDNPSSQSRTITARAECATILP